MPPVERRQQRRPLRLGAGRPLRRIPVRRPAVDVLPVLDREVLEVAEPGVDPDQRRLRIVSLADARLTREPALPRRLDHQPRQPVAPPPVEPIGLRILVDQPLQRPLGLGEPGPDQGGVRCPSVTAAIRRFACAASPGFETMNG